MTSLVNQDDEYQKVHDEIIQKRNARRVEKRRNAREQKRVEQDRLTALQTAEDEEMATMLEESLLLEEDRALRAALALAEESNNVSTSAASAATSSPDEAAMPMSDADRLAIERALLDDDDPPAMSLAIPPMVQSLMTATGLLEKEARVFLDRASGNLERALIDFTKVIATPTPPKPPAASNDDMVLDSPYVPSQTDANNNNNNSSRLIDLTSDSDSNDSEDPAAFDAPDDPLETSADVDELALALAMSVSESSQRSRLMAEQDAAYHAALESDRRRMEEAKRIENAELESAQALANDVDSTTAVPDIGTDRAVDVRFTLPNGARTVARVGTDWTVQQLRAFIRQQLLVDDAAVERFSLRIPMSSVDFANRETTLAELQLTSAFALLVVDE